MHHPAAVQSRTEDLAPLCVRAGLQTIDKQTRTVELVFTTGAAVRRYDWRSGQFFLEKLSLDPAHVRLERLNAGAPLLDTHSGWSLSSQLGVVEDGTAKVSGKRGTATVRFSRRPDVEPVWGDVQDRIVRNVSVGYVVYTYEETQAKGNRLAERLAIDWEPYEISMVPMPADTGAQTRDGKPSDDQRIRTYPCEILIRTEPSDDDADRMRRFRLALARAS